MSHDDAVRARFGATAEGVAAHAREQIDAVREGLGAFLAPLSGDERVLDVGTGAGTLALALAPLVREVVGIDLVPELLEAARRDAPDNVTFVEGDATALPFESFSFDLACSRRTFHHVHRPEVALAELARVTKRGGRVLVDDQIAPAIRSRRSSSTGSSDGATHRTTGRWRTATSAISSMRTVSYSSAASASRTGGSSTTTSRLPAARETKPSARRASRPATASTTSPSRPGSPMFVSLPDEGVHVLLEWQCDTDTDGSLGSFGVNGMRPFVCCLH